MIVLGIDPGLAATGWAILEVGGGGSKKARLVESGCLKTGREKDFSSRLVDLSARARELIKKFKPDCLAIEELYFAKNAKTAIKVAQCAGCLKLTARRAGLVVYEYTPLNIKMTVAGYGRAEKSQVQRMLTRHLDLKKNIVPDHAADAAAVGLTHLFTNRKLT